MLCERASEAPMSVELAANEPRSLHFLSGPYKGDISALCLLPAPWNRRYPLLLAGTGSQILLFDISSFEQLLAAYVFKGVRVHGIGVCGSSFGYWEPSEAASIYTVVAVHGERTVRMFKIMIQERLLDDQHVKLVPYQKLPRFSHWVLDVQFLMDKHNTDGPERKTLVAIGISDNSVYIWNVYSGAFIYHVQCTERCLLYSLRFWGEDLTNLRAAAGTIFNEILVWGLDIQFFTPLFNSGNLKFNEKSYAEKKVVPQRRLKGHEGSIFRIAWSDDGKQLASVSDDRSLRVWSIAKEPCHSILPQSPMEVDKEDHEIHTSFAFYGHTARIWDCHINSKILVSVSEDCTYRVWTADGQPLAKVTAHIGRGIWRCVYDPYNAILITAGADSAIKVHSLSKWLSERDNGDNKSIMGLDQNSEVFSCDLDNGDNCRQNVSLNSKTEYVRCLSLVDPTCLLVATNQGFLKHVCFTKKDQLTWTDIYRNPDGEPILCLDVFRMQKRPSDEGHQSSEDWIVMGDGKGFVTVLCGNWNKGISQANHFCKWHATDERKLLGVFWSESLGPSFVFTANPCGSIHMWKLKHCESHLDKPEDANFIENTLEVLSVVHYQSCFSARIVCLDVELEEEILVCGDQRGNIIAFSVSTMGGNLSMQQPFASFKGAHGISTVASVRIAGKRNQHQILIRSTGKDGCICSFAVDKSASTLTCLRVEKVDAVTVLETCKVASGLFKSLPRMIAAGFTAGDFLIYDLHSDCEIVRIPCGGWRRPHSCHIGDFPEIQHCFVFVKDGIIHVYRKWHSGSPDSSDASVLPITNDSSFLSSLLLHSQFHGREIHSTIIVSSRDYHDTKNKICPLSWIATGSEDGVVRITRFDVNTPDKFNVSEVLGEHVGGSAVRALTSITRYSICNEHESCRQEDAVIPEPTFLLISVGAKEVLTSWLLEWENDFDKVGQMRENLSSRWLNTKKHILKGGLLRKYQEHRTFSGESKQVDDTNNLLDEDDHRYLAVTGFSVFCPQTRSQTCFAVTASSNATLTLHAFQLLEGNWIEISILEYHKVPVISLEHLVVHGCTTSDAGHPSNMYIVFSGATDGSIALWNITKVVFEVCHKQLGERSGKVHRPPSGRGSQGGKRWKILGNKIENIMKEKSKGETESLVDDAVDSLSNIDISFENDSGGAPNSGTHRIKESLCHLHTITPEYVLPVHQSGVNSLSVSTVKRNLLVVVSGGDDQALNVSTFLINSSGSISYLKKECILSAHSSAIKGVWTDGSFVFSTGWDQRLRCWHLENLEQHCPIVEIAHSVIDVPEPAALHVEYLKESNYRIAVAGRGLQVLELRGT